MKFKTHLSKEIKFKGILSCIDWCGTDEIYTCSDDHQIYKWKISTRESQQIAKLPEDFFPTDLNWFTTKTSSNSKNNDSLLITSTDGRLIILNRNARVEKNITAHTAAITSGRWSPDGAGLLTAGEDGVIKVWSRSGMLRSTVIQNEESISCARWSPNSSSIVYCQGSSIAIKPLAANSKLIKWKAHDGLVLCVSWSNNTNLIASGGEDCRYKLWDTHGALIFHSSVDEQSITSLEFSLNGEMLAVGGFNMLKLCHSSGWVHNNIRFSSPSTGSLFGIRWSRDGTQIVSGSGSGIVIFGHVIDKQKVSRNLKALTTGKKTILLEDVIGQTKDTLDFAEKIIQWELGYGHLVVATLTQVQIFNENYINTPIIIDGRTDVSIIILGKKNFIIVDSSSVWVYTYTGRLHINPRYSGSQVQVQHLIIEYITLGLDILAIRDLSELSTVHVFELLPGASRQDEPFLVKCKTQISKISICRAGNTEDQFLAIIDINNDLFVTNVRGGGPDFELFKIGNQVTSIMWASEANILVGLRDLCYTIWYCPGESCSDPTLLSLTTLSCDTTEFGKNLSINNFEGSNITFCGSGINYTVSIKPYFEIIHRCVADGMWKQAIKICRQAQNTLIWSTLAAIATKKNQLDISEEAYCNALQIDKVKYLQYIKSLPKDSPEQLAEISVMNGRLSEAEIILLHNKRIAEAITLTIRMHRWERALEIAQKYESNLDEVLEERKKYLNALEREENNLKFLAIKSTRY